MRPPLSRTRLCSRRVRSGSWQASGRYGTQSMTSSGASSMNSKWLMATLYRNPGAASRRKASRSLKARKSAGSSAHTRTRSSTPRAAKWSCRAHTNARSSSIVRRYPTARVRVSTQGTRTNVSGPSASTLPNPNSESSHTLSSPNTSISRSMPCLAATCSSRSSTEKSNSSLLGRPRPGWCGSSGEEATRSAPSPALADALDTPCARCALRGSGVALTASGEPACARLRGAAGSEASSSGDTGGMAAGREKLASWRSASEMARVAGIETRVKGNCTAA
mmetsp:Transcript_22209/g.71450  ORF Transcript_22209/g.71450 Transcript_22209/m.71450 type:complete len:278 (-) Transcript_22209:109-942(-)